MKISNSISSVLGATSTTFSGSFYAQFNDTLMPITNLNIPSFDFLVLAEPQASGIPKFTLKNGVAYNGEGATQRTFGIAGGVLLFGEEATLKVFHIQLDEHFKVLNLHPYLCKWIHGPGSSGFLMRDDHSSPLTKCSPVDIFFLSSDEAVARISGYGRGKRDLRHVPGKVSQSEFSSSTDKSDFQDKKNGQINPSNIKEWNYTPWVMKGRRIRNKESEQVASSGIDTDGFPPFYLPMKRDAQLEDELD